MNKRKKKIDENRIPLPPGCAKVDDPNDAHVHCRCPKLKFSVDMELRRCTFHGRRHRLIEHIKKGKHSFDRP